MDVLNNNLSSYVYPESNETYTVTNSNSSGKDESRHDYIDHIQTVLNENVLPAICICGILGNSLIIMTMTRHRVRRTVSESEMVVHAGLLVMAITDLLFNISLLPRAFISENKVVFAAGSFPLIYNCYGTGLITMFSLMSTWLIVGTSGLRYVGVCHPLRARYVISLKAIYICISLIIVLCLLGNLPQFWLHKTVDLGIYNGVHMVMFDLGPFSHLHTRGIIYSWIRAIFSIFIPGILLIYFNTRLLLALRASRRLHRSHVRRSTTNERRDPSNSHRLTRTLIAVIVMFILLVYPSELIDFFTHIAPVVSINNRTVIIGRAFTNILQVSNFSFNFILYCAMNSPFRKAVRELARSKCDTTVALNSTGTSHYYQTTRYARSNFPSDENIMKNSTTTTTQIRRFRCLSSTTDCTDI